MQKKGGLIVESKQELHAVISLRLFTDRKCFGPGVAELLRRVEEHHSLRSAAQSMEMAYSKAWTITRNAESALGVRLLERSTGGKNGGGAALTDEARRFLSGYDNCCRRLKSFAAELVAEEFAFYQGPEETE